MCVRALCVRGADGIDNMIDGFVNAVKKGDTAIFGGAKATVLANSNVLMHKEVGGDARAVCVRDSVNERAANGALNPCVLLPPPPPLPHRPRTMATSRRR